MPSSCTLVSMLGATSHTYPITSRANAYAGICRLWFTLAWCINHSQAVLIQSIAAQITALFYELAENSGAILQCFHIQPLLIRGDVEAQPLPASPPHPNHTAHAEELVPVAVEAPVTRPCAMKSHQVPTNYRHSLMYAAGSPPLFYHNKERRCHHAAVIADRL